MKTSLQNLTLMLAIGMAASTVIAQEQKPTRKAGAAKKTAATGMKKASIAVAPVVAVTAVLAPMRANAQPVVLAAPTPKVQPLPPPVPILFPDFTYGSSFGQGGETLPSQIEESLPGQVVQALSGQIVPPLPGQIVQGLPGQLEQPLPGQIVQSLPGQMVPALAGQIVD